MLLEIISLLSFLLVRQNCNAIKCCATVPDYYRANGNCWDNPDAESTQTEILQRWGAKVDEHFLTTDDGYVIFMSTASFNKTKSTPVVFGHGQHHNGDSFVTNYNKSLVYNLLQDGYEVSIINYRGSKYSKGHVNLSYSDEAYWNFGFHEMAVYDLRKCLEFIYSRNKEKSIYIGYSLGTLISFAYSSTFSEEAGEYLQGIISFGPFATLSRVRSLFNPGLVIWPAIRPFFKLVFGNYLPRAEAALDIASKSPLGWLFLEFIERLPIIGIDLGQIDPSYKPVQVFLFEDKIPIGVLDQLSELRRSGKLIQKDYGVKNMEVYGTPTPPVYDLSKIIVPNALFVGKGDFLGDPNEATFIYEQFTNETQCGYVLIKLDGWYHGDFLWAKDGIELLVKPVMEKIKQLEQNSC
ncbi:unnamed protein product [Phyllotreta striolata]|uniref:AB hydrolase-1 domain-containing protein n=1 Tax=Phyllotreta striolata TaxID=444603 RepID=A0A9N9TNF7_PHYSR|nr:unnamed protein product [Phyllotreta striolata]